jgi:hypothetical protein
MMDDNANTPHFSQPQRRKAEFIRPPNLLKEKVGVGGIGDDILDKAQTLLENNAVDFAPLAEIYLASLMKGIDRVKSRKPSDDPEELIAGVIYPVMQLKANGGMFHYALITSISDRLVQFLEVIENPDPDAMEIVTAFHATIRAIILGGITGRGGKQGDELIDALNDACARYFDKHPERYGVDLDYINRV